MLHEWEMEEGHRSFFQENRRRNVLSHRPKIDLKDNIICDLKEVGYEGDLKAFTTWHAYVLVAINFGFHNANDSVLWVCGCKNYICNNDK